MNRCTRMPVAVSPYVMRIWHCSHFKKSVELKYFGYGWTAVSCTFASFTSIYQVKSSIMEDKGAGTFKICRAMESIVLQEGREAQTLFCPEMWMHLDALHLCLTAHWTAFSTLLACRSGSTSRGPKMKINVLWSLEISKQTEADSIRCVYYNVPMVANSSSLIRDQRDGVTQRGLKRRKRRMGLFHFGWVYWTSWGFSFPWPVYSYRPNRHIAALSAFWCENGT